MKKINSKTTIPRNKINMTKKTTKGRQKIEIKKLEDKSTQQVTFSKRRSGLFKKASELCILCGAEIAIIAFSPNHKPFTFGHPNIDTILDRYLTEISNPSLNDENDDKRNLTNNPRFEDFNKEYNEALEKLKEEKKRTKGIEEERKERINEGRFWWDEPIGGLGLEELEEYLEAMQELRKNMINRAKELMIMEEMAANRGDLENYGFVEQNGHSGGDGGHGFGFDFGSKNEHFG